MDAALSGETQYFKGESDEPRWRRFAEAAADADVYSVMSFPLKLDDKVLGALNFYSSERDALRPGQREEGLLFAAQASVVLANAEDYLKAETQVMQLNEALELRTIIGQATGLLMAQHGVTADEAFQMMVTASQHSNIKLRDIARRYVESWEERSRTDPASR